MPENSRHLEVENALDLHTDGKKVVVYSTKLENVNQSTNVKIDGDPVSDDGANAKNNLSPIKNDISLEI